MKQVVIILFMLFSLSTYSQKKVLQTKFISDNINIDGKLNEEIWKSAPIATDFVMFQPDNGQPVPENKRTEVRVLYDNEAVYVGAVMYDNEPFKILKEITERDNGGASDAFAVFINGYNDGQQDFRFIVTASNGQLDCIATDSKGNDKGNGNRGEDFSWDAVWKSKAIVTNFGWVVEMRIPYAALRFSSEKKQTWGINFLREIKRDRQKYSWNFIDSNVGTVLQQNGTLEGIENIKTPTRLFLLPYSSFYVNANAQQKTYGTLKGGLDFKYGINDAFTLDAILIPDFGQTKYDDKILNLTPFEQKFDENRAFFTEGTDLFNKGNLVYSRRIGGSPSNYPTTTTNEEIIENPSNVSLVNALKVSGRTKDGLGIGILNAVTEKTSAIILNKDTQETRREVVEPLANYNILVLDQRFRKNSSIAFVNTNVTRNGNFRDANVSALVWDLNTKKNTFKLAGDFKYSYVNEIEDKKGISTSINIGETSGLYRYSFGADLVTKDYDNNDLGINFLTNYYNFIGKASYKIINSTKYFNSFETSVNIFTQFQKETGKLQRGEIRLNTFTTNKKNNFFGFGIEINPFESYDYYEPRTENRYLIKPSQMEGFVYYSTNYANRFSIDINPVYSVFNEEDRKSYELSFGPRYRFTDKFSLEYRFRYSQDNNNKGYIDSIDEDANSSTPEAIIFANRNVISYSNKLSGKFSINSSMNFNLSIRQYWSYAENKNFLALEQNGKLTDFSDYTENKNFNLDAWNLDLSYSWWFAPGSQISILYRNSASKYDNEINKDFTNNVTNLLRNDELEHVLSISVKYFIDYNTVKHII